MPDTFPTPRVWVAGERVSASKMNEISTALGVLYPFTTAGDIAKRSASGNYLERQSLSSIPGLIHTVGSAFVGSRHGTITTASFVSIGAGVKFDLTLAVPCTVIAWANAMGNTDNGTNEGFFSMAIDGTVNPNDIIRLLTNVNSPFACMYKAAAVPAGTRTVELKYKAASAGDPVRFNGGEIHAIAIVE